MDTFDIIKPMTYNTIKFNGIDVTCFSDGSVEWKHAGKEHLDPKRTFGSRNRNGRAKVKINWAEILVHRLIAEAFLPDFDSRSVDHINGDQSDNRPVNLRMATESQNRRAFRTKQKGCTSKYRGVSWQKKMQKWAAQVTKCGKNTHIGLFDVEEDAAKAWDSAAIENGYFNEALNFPKL